jgi:hypothetical protein
LSYRGITTLKKPITADELYLNIFANLPKVKTSVKISCVDFPSISGYIDAEKNIYKETAKCSKAVCQICSR